MGFDYSDEPRFTIKSVCSQTGILPVTLRAWERRYNLLSPHRSQNRYRLYSERDIAILRWVKTRVDEGTAISAAVDELHQLLGKGIFPETTSPLPAKTPPQSNIPPEQYARQLYQAFISHDDARAHDLMREAQYLFDLNTFLFKIISSTLYEIGEAWYYGKIRVATEHFATAVVRARLIGLLESFPIRRNIGHILLGCAPTELHELNALMFAVLLRSTGLRVEYLGVDIPLDDLVDYAAEVRPDMIILTATLESSALELVGLQEKLNRVRSKVIFGYGGMVFSRKPELKSKIGGIFLGDSMDQAVAQVKALILDKNKARIQ